VGSRDGRLVDISMAFCAALRSHYRPPLLLVVRQMDPALTPPILFLGDLFKNLCILLRVEEDEVGGTCGTNGGEEERV
jgi:hypothetical protein